MQMSQLRCWEEQQGQTRVTTMQGQNPVTAMQGQDRVTAMQLIKGVTFFPSPFDLSYFLCLCHTCTCTVLSRL